MGLDPDPPASRPRPVRPPLTQRQLVIVAVFMGALYAFGMAVRGDLLPGVIGGVLVAWLLVLVLREAQRQRAVRQRARESGPVDPPAS